MFAANLVGVGKPSEASEAFLCEKWTMPEPGKETAPQKISVGIINQEAANICKPRDKESFLIKTSFSWRPKPVYQ